MKIFGGFSYDCSMEKYYLKEFKRLKNIPDNISLVFKQIPKDQKLLTGKKVLIFTDHTSRFEKYFNSVKDKFDIIFLLHNEKIVDNKKFFFLPCSYDPETHYSLDLQKDTDTLFIGTRTIEREFLKDIPYLIKYGSGWGERPSLEKTRELYSKAKIVINQHYKHDTNNMRDYESAAMKCFTLSDFSPFKSGVTYKDTEDLKEKIKYYLEHGKEREENIEKCWEEAKNETYEKRAKYILEVIKNHG